jgi:pantothenate kinase
VEGLNTGASAGAAPAVLVPLDGFHLPNRELIARGLRDRKGAPGTFDIEAYLDLLRAVRRIQPADAIRFPIYDRTAHEPVWGDGPDSRVTATQTIVVTEGNYLLLDRPPWSALAEVLDECWWVETPVDVARDRLLARHQRGGRSADDALAHYQRTDLPNTRLVLECSRKPTLRVLG